MPIELKNRVTSANSFGHERGLSRWVFLLRDVARKHRPFIFPAELKALIPNDNRELSLRVLKFMTSIVLKSKRDPQNPNYYFAGARGEEKLFAGFQIDEEKISAPLPCNLSSRHSEAPFVLELHYGMKKKREKIVVTIIEGKLEIIGNIEKILSFLS